MQKLNPIPTSPSVTWRRVRLNVIPVIVFCGVVAAILMQWRTLDGGGFPGVAEGTRALVSAPQVGMLQEVKVRPYEWVEAGQQLATFVPIDPRAKLDLLQSELQIARLRLEPSLADQHALDFERWRVENLRLRQELASAKVNLQRAENTLRRNAELRQEKLVSAEAYDLSLRDRDMYQAEISEKTKAVLEIEDRMAKLRVLGEPEQPGSNQPLRTVLASLDAKILDAGSNWCAIPLVAPISGMVHVVSRQSGEYVTEGEPLFTVNSAKSDRIIAYLRQPYTIEPEPGMEVEVATRTRQRQKFAAKISQIGAQVECITNVLAFMRVGALVDAGLPVIVNVPPGVNVRPGEIVDISLRTPPAPTDVSPPGATSSVPTLSRIK
jgi:multidrug resistance efflux pump